MAIWKVHRTAFLVALTALLLAVLAILQYRWVGELSRFERQQMSRTLEALTEGFVRDIDRTFGRIRAAFDVGRPRDVEAELVEEYRDWAESAAFPDLIADVFWVDEGPGQETPADAPRAGLRLRRLDIGEGRLYDMEWPDSLGALEHQLDMVSEEFGRRRFRQDGNIAAQVDGDRLALAIAQEERWPPSWAVVVLRRDVLLDQLLPFALEEYFGTDQERDFDIWILDRGDEGRVIYTSNALAQPASADSYDIRRDLDDDGPGWLVAASHRTGSLDAFVGQYRARNISLGFGVVVVLGISFLFLLVATRRAEWLAERQMEFVAGVSHELRTPIAGISSLSQNLADGVVQDPQHAARYGQSINRESRRLADMVDTVLGFAAVRSARRRYDAQPVDLGQIVSRELESLGRNLDGVRVDCAIENDLPPVSGDEEALRIVVRNLVSNAVKFGGDRGAVSVSVRAPEGLQGPELELCVRDQGPGIPRSDLAHIFKPFYRGREAREGQVKGSGLGLSLVQEIVGAHRGRVEVDARPGEGSRFSVYLPLARAEAADGSRR